MVTESTSPLERALRWLATRPLQKPFGLLVHALEDPNGESAAHLMPLLDPTASMPGGTPQTRALAVWGLIIDTIDKIGPTKDSRRRNALVAAFRLPRRPEIKEPWRSTLDSRFHQLMDLPGIFGDPPPVTITPMHKAWTRAVHERLTPMLRERLTDLAVNGPAWMPYVEIGRATEAEIANDPQPTDETADSTTGYRQPSPGAQPLFMDLFVTTVFMRGRTVYRRITERLITAREDNVEAYLARALAGPTRDPADVPVRGLWGCRAEPLVASRSGAPALTKLWFPTPLRRGEKHYFSSETINENLTEERLRVNVEIDHHGIAPGRRLHGLVPVSGLTIRVRFDPDCVPQACWYYGEQTERERLQRPPDGDPHLLTIIGGAVEHTFAEKCHPRESYGMSFLWPTP
ncbi:MAG TPA: hypothetical protein VGX25_01440 [Actinophytocola sp.]|uniref:hypothetical protein n=1 Tax=Actinophytocola sp. TaxID=1872138 RepID=UPI002DDCE400|nr:hypothetical protein [Actinophytocola sp.]HEV2778040.1 hypothetical protein [Actinophytocola sp.]